MSNKVIPIRPSYWLQKYPHIADAMPVLVYKVDVPEDTSPVVPVCLPAPPAKTIEGHPVAAQHYASSAPMARIGNGLFARVGSSKRKARR